MDHATRAYDWIAHHAANRAGHLAVADLHTGQRLSYQQFDARIQRLAGALHARGIGRGDRVAILAQNCADTLALQFATARLGAVFVPLNWRLTVPELDFILGDAAPGLLVHDAEFGDTALALTRLLVERGIHMGLLARGGAKNDDSDDSEASAFEVALREATPWATPVPLHHHDTSTIMYTSGTTGHPKGAVITHGMTFWNAVNLSPAAEITPQAVALTVMPLFHTGGLNCYANPVLHAGGTVLVARAFDPAATLRLIADPAVGLTHFFGVPAHYQFMAQAPAFETTDFSRLQVAGVGGAAMPVPVLNTWLAKGLAIIQGYGMTETSPSVLCLDRRDAARKAGSAGRPVLHTELRVVDAEGQDVAPGEMGELWVRGPNITPGYWNRPEANRNAFTDGWLHTGDAVRVDEEGFYYIVDRTKDMYISGGENVYPAEVENVLYQLPQVAEAAVIGIADARWGETGKAILVLKDGQQLTADQVLDHCRERLARFKLPREVVFTGPLPRNATGKVHKPTLRAAHGG